MVDFRGTITKTQLEPDRPKIKFCKQWSWPENNPQLPYTLIWWISILKTYLESGWSLLIPSPKTLAYTEKNQQSLGSQAEPHNLGYFLIFFFKIVFIYFYFLTLCLFLERGEGREKDRESNIDVWGKHWSVASHTPPARDLALNPGMCLNRESNQPPFSWQDDAQSTEHRSKGWKLFIHISCKYTNIDSGHGSSPV